MGWCQGGCCSGSGPYSPQSGCTHTSPFHMQSIPHPTHTLTAAPCSWGRLS